MSRKYVNKGMGVAFADYYDDGFTDVFVSNDTLPNLLLHNDGNGTFTATHSKRHYGKVLDHLFAFAAARPIPRELLMEWRSGAGNLGRFNPSAES